MRSSLKVLADAIDSLGFVRTRSTYRNCRSMPCRKKENRKNAPCICFAAVITIVSEEDNLRLVLSRQLNKLCRSPGMQAKMMPDGNLPLVHVFFFGASSSLAI